MIWVLDLLKNKLYIRNKNFLWWPYLLTDWDKISNLYRWLSIYVFYHALLHFAMQFQRRRLLEIDQELHVAAILLTNRNKMFNLHRELSIYVSYKVKFMSVWVNIGEYITGSLNSFALSFCNGEVQCKICYNDI
jgi:hypothetical protein